MTMAQKLNLIYTAQRTGNPFDITSNIKPVDFRDEKLKELKMYKTEGIKYYRKALHVQAPQL